MRVAVISDALAGISGAEASQVIGLAFAELGASVVTPPFADTGEALHAALTAVVPGAVLRSPHTASHALADLEMLPAQEIVLDLTNCSGDVIGADLSALLSAATKAVALTAVVPDNQAQQPLTGLTGLAATAGRAAGTDLAQVLAADQRAEAWAARWSLPVGAGAGAAGGLGAVVARLGGGVLSPFAFLSARLGLPRTLRQADLVVTGAELLDFHTVGGPLVKRVVALAAEALCPVIAIAGRNFISARELRLAGLEAAYPILAGSGDGAADVAGLARVAARVASSWYWDSSPTEKP